MMQKFLLILIKKLCWKYSDYRENSDEGFLEKIQLEKNSDEENSDEENSGEAN